MFSNPSKPPSANQTEAQRLRRRQAAELLLAVVGQQLTPRQGLSRWPAMPSHDALPDESLKAAYNALWHVEADEEAQQREMFYLDAQLELLRQMARYLAEGLDLPAFVLQAYRNKPDVVFFDDRAVIQKPLFQLKRWLMAACQIVLKARQSLGDPRVPLPTLPQPPARPAQPQRTPFQQHFLHWVSVKANEPSVPLPAIQQPIQSVQQIYGRPASPARLPQNPSTAISQFAPRRNTGKPPSSRQPQP